MDLELNEGQGGFDVGLSINDRSQVRDVIVLTAIDSHKCHMMEE